MMSGEKGFQSRGRRFDAWTVKWIVAFLAAVIVLAYTGIPSTFSYLTASSEAVINTFAAGAIALRLDETELDANGESTGGRTTRNSYKVIPGMTLTKDPTVTILTGSEECYVFLYLDNQLPEEYFTLNLSDYAEYWLVAAESDGDQTIYVYKTTIDALESESDIALEPLFTTVEVSEDLSTEVIEDFDALTITVEAFAVQAYGVELSTAIDLAVEYFKDLYDDVWGTVKYDVSVTGSSDSSDDEDDEEEGEEEEQEETEEDEEEAEEETVTTAAEEEAAETAEEETTEESEEEATATTEEGEEEAAETAEEETTEEDGEEAATTTEEVAEEETAEEVEGSVEAEQTAEETQATEDTGDIAEATEGSEAETGEASSEGTAEEETGTVTE